MQAEFREVTSNKIETEILHTDHMLGKIQLLGILLRRHGTNYMVENITGRRKFCFLYTHVTGTQFLFTACSGFIREKIAYHYENDFKLFTLSLRVEHRLIALSRKASK